MGWALWGVTNACEDFFRFTCPSNAPFQSLECAIRMQSIPCSPHLACARTHTGIMVLVIMASGYAFSHYKLIISERFMPQVNSLMLLIWCVSCWAFAHNAAMRDDARVCGCMCFHHDDCTLHSQLPRLQFILPGDYTGPSAGICMEVS